MNFRASKGERARNALERLTYGFYLKDKLKVSFKAAIPERIWIADRCFTKEEFKEYIGLAETTPLNDTLLTWARTNISSESDPIEFIYQSLKKGDAKPEFEELKKRLQLRWEAFVPESISINGEPFTHTELEKKIDPRSNVSHDTIFNWARGTVIAELDTLECLYDTFGKGGTAPTMFTEFKGRAKLCHDYIDDKFPEYLEYIENSKKSPFNSDELNSYAYTLTRLINRNPLSSADDKRQTIKTMGLILGTLLQGTNTISKEVMLRKILSEVKPSAHSREDRNTLKEIETRIDGYLQNNPLSMIQSLVAKTVSVFSKPILILLVGTIAVAGFIAIVHTITAPITNDNGQLPFFGITEPYDPNSPLATLPSNLDSANYWFELGESVSDDSLRIIYFTNAIRHRYDFGEAYFYRGLAKKMLRFIDESIIDYTSSIQLIPSSYEAYYNRAHSQFVLGRYHEAIKDYSRSIDIEPQYAPSYFNRGQAHFNLLRYEEALEDYTRCVELNPSHQWAFLQKGSTELILGLYKEAISDFNHALELDSLDSKAYAKRGQAKLELAYDTSKDLNATSRIRELLREAQSDMSKALEIDPSDSISAIGIAHIQDFENIITNSETSIQLAKENVLRTEKEFLSAMENYKNALKMSDTLRENRLLDSPQ